MTSKLTITDERIEKIAVWLATESHSLNLEMLTCLRELQERRKADSEPVAEKVACWSCKNEVEISAIGDCDGYCPICNSPIDLDEEPYTAPKLVPDRDQVRREHADWSQATFGNVGPVGPLKHLSKEALEAAAEPGDLSEWADMQFLLWDAQRRAGITDEQITQAMIEKLAVNKQREWPEPKDGEPRLHIKEQPAPVVQCVPLGDSPYDVPYSMPSNLRELIAEEIGILFSDDDAQSVWNVCRRAAMLQAGSDEIGSWANDKNTPTSTPITPAAPDKKLTDDVLDEIIAGAKTSMEQYLALSLKAEREVWRKEGPTDDERIMAIEGMIQGLRCGDNGWVVGEMGITRCACGQDSPVCTCPSGDGSLRWPCPSHPGNSLVIGIDMASGPDRTVEVRYVADTWIPVSERMPDKNQDVLISVNFDSDLVEPLICSARYTGSTFRRGDATVKPGSGVEQATHWMPLPAAPQEVKGE